MHEVGIMESALALMQRQATAHQARRVDRVVLRIGRWPAWTRRPCASPSTWSPAPPVAERRHPRHRVRAGRGLVPGLRASFPATEDGFIFTCPGCNDLCGEIRRGRELELSRLEMS
jgi:Zn finger protein HypA/HybF involved in hydrogenase expression